jgi:hypothetical protein
MSVNRFFGEIRDALSRHASHEELIKIVLCYKSLGISQQGASSALEQLRNDLCTDDEAEESPTCSNLGAVMDRVWGYCSQSERLWESSLSEAAR